MGTKEKRLGICFRYPVSPVIVISRILALALPYPEHLSPTHGAHTLSRRSTVLHGYGFSIFHFPLGTALNAVCLHIQASLFSCKTKLLTLPKSTERRVDKAKKKLEISPQLLLPFLYCQHKPPFLVINTLFQTGLLCQSYTLYSALNRLISFQS